MAYEVNYSFAERLTHRIAFGVPETQLVAAELEQRLFSRSYSDVVISRPIFVTSLPRAGTTILLKALSRFKSVATHTYRDMPFVMAPILWDRISSRFRIRGQLSERAHKDGLLIGFDSPEAFEEVLWSTHWPDHYDSKRIGLWGAEDRNEKAERFIREHMKKIIALRVPEQRHHGRYASKNNANIARLKMLRRVFQDSHIVVVVRNPIAHASSLLEQHINFLRLQSENAFVRRYMHDIGHFEFGILHRPISFPQLDAHVAGRRPTSIQYWLGYWVAAFEYIASLRDHVYIVCYERLCQEPKIVLDSLCRHLGLEDDPIFGEAAAMFVDRHRKLDVACSDKELIDQANDLYAKLIV